MKQMKVDAIKNGTVIDHIPAGKGMQVADIINISGKNEVLIGVNLQSRKVGRKDILKIENRELSQEEINSIALIAADATLTIIKDYEKVRKTKAEIPKAIQGLIKCPNPKCITNSEKIKTKFKVTGKNPLKVRCCYCEKKYLVDDVKIKI